MMTPERQNDLFPSGYREPGDDCERIAYYILCAFGLLGGLALAAYAVFSLFHPAVVRPERWWLTGIELVFGITVSVGSGWFFMTESAKWDLKKISADKIVAGVFLFGIALIILGFNIAFPPPPTAAEERPIESALITLAGVSAGTAVCLVALYIGILFALAEKIRDRPRRIKTVQVIRRYAIDDKLNVLPEYATPSLDGMTPIVELRTKRGRGLRLRATADGYDLADPGKTGDALVRGNKLYSIAQRR